MPSVLRGIIEGFYGTPWTWDERHELAYWCAQRGMDTFVYAPKSDPKHRERWREPYDTAELGAFETFAATGGLRLGFALSPGLSIDHTSADDLEALLAKCRQVAAVGVDLFVLAVDDIAPTPGLGLAHGHLAAAMLEHLGGDVVVVPTDYTSTRPTAYLDDLVATLPDDAAVAWTGPTVVCDEITVADAIGRADAVGGRLPVLWDNYPVNDVIMADRLFLGPLRGRARDLVPRLAGYVANPMVQARPNLLPLASTAAWLRGDDPQEAWDVTVDQLGWRRFAEACDGVVPRGLVADLVDGRSGAADRLDQWLGEAASCTAPGLEGVVDEWLAQVHREARVGRDALAQSDETDALARLGVLMRWRRLMGATVTVMGPRLSVRPVVGQDDHGGFVVDRASAAVERHGNAIDRMVMRLCRASGQCGSGSSEHRGTRARSCSACAPVTLRSTWCTPPVTVRRAHGWPISIRASRWPTPTWCSPRPISISLPRSTWCSSGSRTRPAWRWQPNSSVGPGASSTCRRPIA
jgi:hypothetical protein